MDLKEAATKLFDKFQGVVNTRPARMGRVDQTVIADAKRYLIWVTYFDGTTEKVLNQRIPNSFGKLVLIGYDPIHFPTRKQVLALWDVYPDAQWAGTGQHQETHQWGGVDPLWVHGEQFLPGLIVPVPGQLKIKVYPIAKLGATSWKLFTTAILIDVSDKLPANGYRYSLLVVDYSNTYTFRDGPIVLSRSGLLDSTIPLPSRGDNVIGAIVFYAGQTEIIKRTGASDILDLRFSNPLVNSFLIDGNSLPDMSPTKKGGVPPTGTPSGKYLTDYATFTAIPDVISGGANGLMLGTDKAKLDTVASGAEVNVNADWNAVSGDAQILNKPILPTAPLRIRTVDSVTNVTPVETIIVTNGTLTNNSGGQVTIDTGGGSSGITQLTGDVTAGPGSGSQAATISNKVTMTATSPVTVSGSPTVIAGGAVDISLPAATASTPGHATAAQITKLDGIEAGANNYVHPTTPGNIHLPTLGASTQIIQYASSGTGKWITVSGDGSLADNGSLTINKTRLLVRNETGASIPTTKAVYVSGYNSDRPLISLADNTDEGKHNVMGITVGAIGNATNGYIATSGQCDAETNSWPVGTELYLSTSGALTSTEPTAGSVQHVGIVTVQQNYPDGKLLIFMQPEGNVIGAGTGQGITLRLGDGADATKLSVRNSSNTETASVTSTGKASFSTVNKVTITPPTTSATITITDGKTLSVPLDASVSGTNTGDQTLASLGGIGGAGIAGRVAEFVTDTKTLQAAKLIGPATNILTITNAAASTLAMNVSSGKTLTLTAADNYSLTIPATGTAALLGITNTFTIGQIITATAANENALALTISQSQTAVGFVQGMTLKNANATNGNYVSVLNYDSRGAPNINSWIDFINVSHTTIKGAIAFVTRNATDYSRRMYINEDGKVGIGTTANTRSLLGLSTPTGIAYYDGGTAQLEIYGANIASSNGGQLQMWATDAATADKGPSITFGGDFSGGANYTTWAAIAGRKQTAMTTGGYLQFSTKINLGVMTEAARFTSAGSMGIGATEPAAKLDVLGTGLFGTSAIAATRFTYGDTLSLHNPTNTKTTITFWQDGQSLGHVGYLAGDTTLTISNDYYYPTPAKPIVLTKEGNFGIGLIAPSGRLHGRGSNDIGSFMHWDCDALDATPKTIIPDGASGGDVTVSAYIMASINGNVIGARSGVLSIGNNSTAQLFNDGSNRIDITVSAAGAMTIFRVSGAQTYKISAFILWI